MSRKREYGQRRYRVKHHLLAAIVSKRMTQKDFAALVGVSQQAVSATLNGLIHSAKVLEKFREMGVPEKFLCDPRKGKEAA